MRNSKHGLKALIVGIMTVLGAMALAAGAQAQTHTPSHTETLEHTTLLHAHALHEPTLNPSPLLEPSKTSTPGTYLINLGAALLATLAARQIGEGRLLVASRSLEIRCGELSLNAAAKIDSSTDALGEVTFKKCVAFDHKTLLKLPCEFKVLETITATALVLPILHGGENFLLFEPQIAGGNFTVITFKEGTGCPLPLNNPVTGSVTALVHALDAVKQLILFSEGIQLLTGDKLTFGGFSSYIKGHGEVELTGPHAGQKLGIH